MPYLKILYWFHSKGLTCYLTKEQWPEWLVRFGGKPIHYRKQKARWAKLRALGYITTYFTNGNRNKEMEHHLSQKGIQAVDNFQSQSRFKLKNGPSKIEKRPLEPVKNGPSLNHAQCENKHALNIERLMKEDPAKADSYRFMEDFGFFPAVALQVLKDYTRNQIYQAYTYTREKKPRNYGAYMLKILKKQLKKLNKEVA